MSDQYAVTASLYGVEDENSVFSLTLSSLDRYDDTDADDTITTTPSNAINVFILHYNQIVLVIFKAQGAQYK